jgi:Trp operon repressor
MEPIISLSYIEKKVDLKCNSKELIQFLKKTKFVIRPPDFESLKKTIDEKLKPREKKNYSLLITGLLPSGERTEVVDDDTYTKEISLFIVSYKKASRGPLFSSIKAKSFFSQKNLELPDFSSNTSRLSDFRNISEEIKKDQIKRFDSMINDLDESFDKSLNESVQEIILSATQENIKKVDKLRSSFMNINSKLKEKKDKCKMVIRKNSVKLNDITNKIEANKSNPIEKIPEIPETIFSFEPNKISVEKDIDDFDPKKIKIPKITVKNLTEQQYPQEMLWFKEKDSDKDINFDQSDRSNEYPFEKDRLYKSGKESYDYQLDLIIDEPKEMTQYKMIITIINKDDKQKLSDTLEIVVKMTKKGLSQREIDNILNELKGEMKDFDLFLKEEDVLEIIRENKGDKDIIKKSVKEMYDKNYKKKLDELLDRLENEMNYSKFLKREEVEKEIKNLNFDEDEIKSWISSKKPSLPEPQPKPDPQPPAPTPINIDVKKMEEILGKLEDNWGLSGYEYNEEELRKVIVDSNYNYDVAAKYVEDNILL